jgi:S1-C subfamily serine protease
LRDIVTHVFIASVPYDADPAGAGFLGLSWVPDEPDNPQEGGVPVARRLPGFIAYRMLREGDVIKGIARHGREEMVSTSTFAEIIKAIGADQTITFLVLRDGKLIRVPVRLSARPAGNGAMNLTVWLEAWIAENQRRADEYWQQHFAPLVGDDDDGVS